MGILRETWENPRKLGSDTEGKLGKTEGKFRYCGKVGILWESWDTEGNEWKLGD